jgi:hypothetical protein
MQINDYFLECHARYVLDEARAAAARAALIPRGAPRARPALGALLAAARTLCASARSPRSLPAPAPAASPKPGVSERGTRHQAA